MNLSPHNQPGLIINNLEFPFVVCLDLFVIGPLVTVYSHPFIGVFFNLRFCVHSNKAGQVQVRAFQAVSARTLCLQDGEWSGQCGRAENLPGGQTVSEVKGRSPTHILVDVTGNNAWILLKVIRRMLCA